MRSDRTDNAANADDADDAMPPTAARLIAASELKRRRIDATANW